MYIADDYKRWKLLHRHNNIISADISWPFGYPVVTAHKSKMASRSNCSSELNLRSNDFSYPRTVKLWCVECSGKGYQEVPWQDLLGSEPNLNLLSVSDCNSNNTGSRSYGPACDLRPAPDGISRYTPGAGTLSKQHLNHRHDMWNTQPKRQDLKPKHKDSTRERPLKRFLRKKRQKKPHNSTKKIPATEQDQRTSRHGMPTFNKRDSYDTPQEPEPDYDSKLFLGINIKGNAYLLFVWHYEYRVNTLIYYYILSNFTLLSWWLIDYIRMNYIWLRHIFTILLHTNFFNTGVIGSDVPWLECPACNALTWVITVTE